MAAGIEGAACEVKTAALWGLLQQAALLIYDVWFMMFDFRCRASERAAPKEPHQKSHIPPYQKCRILRLIFSNPNRSWLFLTSDTHDLCESEAKWRLMEAGIRQALLIFDVWFMMFDFRCRAVERAVPKEPHQKSHIARQKSHIPPYQKYRISCLPSGPFRALWPLIRMTPVFYLFGRSPRLSAISHLECVQNSINGLRTANFVSSGVKFFVGLPASDCKICLVWNKIFSLSAHHRNLNKLLNPADFDVLKNEGRN